MVRTKDALKIIDRMVGNDAELRQMIAEEKANAAVAGMILDARTDAGLTQAELADLVGTKQPVIARLEDAEYQGHSLSMLNRIAKALNRQLVLDMQSPQPTVMTPFIYVMTHLSDPDANGCWGRGWGGDDCMGEKRSLKYDAVIGVGGVGAKVERFAGKLKWIGIGPHKCHVDGKRGPDVTFDHFLDFGIQGPVFEKEAPKLAARLKKAKRFFKRIRTTNERAELDKLLEMARNAPPSPTRTKRRRARDQGNCNR
jgi:transcriptional regulator with XRE-family HTH domain